MNILFDILSKCPLYFNQGPAALIWSVVHFPLTYKNILYELFIFFIKKKYYLLVLTPTEHLA